MSDAPTLTDEQIEDLRIEIVETNAGLALRQARLSRYDAAVVARAKREERERVADLLEEWVNFLPHAADSQGNNALAQAAALVRHDEANWPDAGGWR